MNALTNVLATLWEESRTRLEDKIGNITYYDSSGENEYGFSKPYSESTAELIDKEISSIIETQYQRAIELLQENKDKLTELAEVLLKEEVIFKDNLETIFGKRPFKVEEIIQPTIEVTDTDDKNDEEE